MSIHTFKAHDKAKRLGGFAGNDHALPLFDLSKRELVEIAIRLGAQAGGNVEDEALGIAMVNQEREALSRAGII